MWRCALHDVHDGQHLAALTLIFLPDRPGGFGKKEGSMNLIPVLLADAPAPDVTSTITSALGGVSGQFLAIGAVGIGIGVAVFLLHRGWKLVKRFI